jgi:hypothetical protein
MEIELEQGSARPSAGRFTLDLAGIAGGMAVRPALGHWLRCSVRQSYLNLIEDQLDFPGVPRYGDVIVWADNRLTERVDLTVLGLASYDRFSLPSGELEFVDGDLLNEQDQIVAGIAFDCDLSPRSLIRRRYTFTYAAYDAGYREGYDDEHEGMGNLTTERIHRFDLDYSYRPTGSARFSSGLSCQYSEGDFELFIRNYVDQWGHPHEPIHLREALHQSELAGYLEVQVPVDSLLDIVAGVRFDRNWLIDEGNWSQRVKLTRRSGRNLVLSLAVSQHAQAPCLLWLASDVENLQLPYFRTTHLIFGLQWKPAEQTRVKAEVYRKTYHNYPVSSWDVVKPMTDYGTAFLFYDTRSIYDAAGGYARGLEVSINTVCFERLDFFVGGSLHTSRFRVRHNTSRFESRDEPETRGAFDTEYSLVLQSAYSSGSGLAICCSYSGAGGLPYTPINRSRSIDRGFTTYNLYHYNEAQYPPYQRLDVRASYTVAVGEGKLTTYLDLINLLDRDNPYFHYWDDQTLQVSTFNQFGRLPLFGISYDW